MPAETWKPSPSDRAVIEALILEEKKSASAAEFSRDFLPFGDAKWSKIKNAIDPEAKDSYFDKVSSAMQEELLGELRSLTDSIPLERARAERMNDQEIIPLSQFRAVAVAVSECRNKKTPERLVKYLAPTGGGKSMLCNYLVKKEKAQVVEARDVWKRSYFTVLKDLCKALRISVTTDNSPSMLEDALIKELSSKRYLLVIDEAEFFGASAINGLKLLLNNTRLVLVTCSIPEAHDKWNRYFPMEAGQLSRRTHAIVELSVINPKDAALFFPDDQFKDPETALKFIAEEASRFGHFSLLKRVARRLEGDSRANADAVKKAVESAQRQMIRGGAVNGEPKK
jgi:hypothetical protein